MIELRVFRANAVCWVFLKSLKGGSIIVAMTPKVYRKILTRKTFARLKKLRRQHPLGTVEEVIRWKNMGAS
ncbi:MAG: hypothetical protein CMF39_04975 [Legionellaceae bacterium]|nr:hypothetical protein [Legionellaceae bacterium]